MQTNKKGNIFIISAVPGTDRTTLVSRLLKNNDDIRISISHTTRQPREGERHDVYYHFAPKEEPESLVRQDALLEHADVFGNYYGISIAGVDELRGQGYDIVLEVGVQGAEQVHRLLPEAYSIFTLSPSLEILASRPISHDTDSEEVVCFRLDKACYEIGQAPLFDYIVVNGDLDTAEADLLHTIKAGRLKQTVQKLFIENLSENSQKAAKIHLYFTR